MILFQILTKLQVWNRSVKSSVSLKQTCWCIINMASLCQRRTGFCEVSDHIWRQKRFYLFSTATLEVKATRLHHSPEPCLTTLFFGCLCPEWCIWGLHGTFSVSPQRDKVISDAAVRKQGFRCTDKLFVWSRLRPLFKNNHRCWIIF